LRTVEFLLATLTLIILTACLSACETTSGGHRRSPSPTQSPDGTPQAGEPEIGSPPETEERLTAPVRVKVIEVREAGILEVKRDGKRQRVRLLGLTAPRPPGRKEPKQHYGAEARAWVEEQILDRHVRLQSLADRRRDKRDRILAYVLVEGRDFNARLVRRGLAWGDASADHPRREEYRKLEREARKARRGMWGRED